MGISDNKIAKMIGGKNTRVMYKKEKYIERKIDNQKS